MNGPRELVSSYSQGLKWVSLWSATVIPNVKVFGWRLYHDILLTLSNLKKRHVLKDSVCQIRSEGEENIEHLFKLCPFAVRVWKLSLLRINSLECIPI